MARKIKTPLEQMWEKEIKRLRRFIKNAETRGFSFSDYTLPQRPEKITEKSVSRLQQIKPETLYRVATYTTNSGEKITGLEGRAYERRNASIKAVKTREIKRTQIPGIKMAAIKTRTTENEKEWQKQISRIRAIVNRVERRGYIVDSSIMPDMPKRVTKKGIERLSKITSQNIYEFSKYNDNGTLIPGTEGRKKEKSRAGKKGYQNRVKKAQQAAIAEIARERFYNGRNDGGNLDRGTPPNASFEIIENIREEIRKWVPNTDWNNWQENLKNDHKNILERMLEGAIRQEGEAVIAARLQQSATIVLDLVNKILYAMPSKGTNIQANLAALAQIIYGRPLTDTESIEIAEAQEAIEDNEENE